ncbi:GntR family transcriptional regulator [Paracoccus sp. JM45]|uniref:GntR family transcriptional regulator n=1 Tax=Paracoccus sp. JM45 TaxID=2283626 RepID=UPI000E6CD85E|nr:GntR family transcriptional regulator [Paracoccus sp. JM45]RJE81441.1 GntR family transcriptional regulator [Paracoccus sp. JM45]
MSAPRSADQIHASLSAQIVAGQLRPGDPLAEAALADRFNMSRTPVREALQRMAAEGLVERGPRRAFIVRRMTPTDLGHMFEALGEIEALCARLAAQRMTPIARAQLTEILAVECRTHDDYAALNRRFHEALRLGAGNQVLSDLLADLNRRTLPWRNAQFHTSNGRMDSSRQEHHAILQAIIAQDGDKAAALMRDHMAGSLAVVLAMIAPRETTGNPPPSRGVTP